MVAVIGLLLLLLLPVLTAARKRSLETNCSSNLRQIGVALGLYASDQEGKFPCLYRAEI